MKWLPTEDMWFTYLDVREEVGDLTYDLAMDVTGGRPSPIDAGLVADGSAASGWAPWAGSAIALGTVLLLGMVLLARRGAGLPPATA
jgi:hypothetical protein